MHHCTFNESCAQKSWQAGIHAVVCFLYLDDLIVTGRTEEEFLINMGKSFQRLREKGITLNPEKCVLGAGKVEYVGHTLNSTGLHFERSKLDSILEWERPTTQKQLKRFLGVVNWCRDHVKNHSIIVRPLNQLIRNYSKSRQIENGHRFEPSRHLALFCSCGVFPSRLLVLAI